MKKVAVLSLMISAVFLTGCNVQSKEISTDYILPSELSDCKIFRIVTEFGSSIKVVRCPDSTTTQHPNGKSTINTTLMNSGVQNMPKNDGSIVVNGRTYKAIKESDIIDFNGVSYVAVD